MSPEAQRIAIAEACHWQTCEDCDPCIGGRPDQCAVSRPPDYLTDLNAMHEAEKVLTGKQADLYAIEISKQTEKPFVLTVTHNFFAFVHATASQRAEAFLRTLGKWTDS